MTKISNFIKYKYIIKLSYLSTVKLESYTYNASIKKPHTEFTRVSLLETET